MAVHVIQYLQGRMFPALDKRRWLLGLLLVFSRELHVSEICLLLYTPLSFNRVVSIPR
jgi:hypothetical protein